MRAALDRHRALYAATVGAPYPVAWGRDSKLLQRLLKTYGPDTLQRLQDAFFAEPLDSPAGRQGYTVPALWQQAPALLARLQAEDQLTAAQREQVAALEAAGLSHATALACVRTVPAAHIQAWLTVWPQVRARFRHPSATLARALRDRWPPPDLTEAAWTDAVQAGRIPAGWVPLLRAVHTPDAPPAWATALHAVSAAVSDTEVTVP